MKLKREVLPSRSWLLERAAIVVGLLALASSAACTDETPPASTGAHVVEMCGQPPTFPPYAYGVERLESGRLMIVITTEAHGELVGYRRTVEAWSDCVADLP